MLSSFPRALIVLPLLAAAACEKVPLLAPTQSTIILVPSTTVVAANGTAQITASVIEQAGTVVQNGTLVTFTTNLGSIEPREGRTQNGQVTVEFRANGQSGTAKIGAFSGGIRATDLELRVGGAAADRVTLRAEPANVPTSGGQVQVTATVLDASGNGLAGVPVSFTVDNGQLSAGSVTTGSSGQAQTTLTTSRTTRISAAAGSKSADLTITAVAVPSVSVSLAPGTSAEAGGPTVFTVTPQSGSTGNPLANVAITFGDGASTNLGAIGGATTVTHIYAAAGRYTVTATAVDSAGFSSTSSSIINVTERSTVPVTVTATPSVVSLSLNQGLVSFTVSTGGLGTGGASIRFYQWDFGDGNLTTTTGPGLSYRYAAAGNYTAKVSVTTTTGQQGFGQTQVRVTP